jgi:hypothetical protein
MSAVRKTCASLSISSPGSRQSLSAAPIRTRSFCFGL